MVDLPSRTNISEIQRKSFVSMVSKFGVSKLTIVFKIAFVKLISSYPKIKTIREVCKENTNEFR